MASGKSDKLKGRVKEAAGALTGNAKLKRKGLVDQAVGNIKQMVEDVIGGSDAARSLLPAVPGDLVRAAVKATPDLPGALRQHVRGAEADRRRLLPKPRAQEVRSGHSESP